MKYVLLLFTAGVLVSISFKSDDVPGSLDGTWKVDLRPTPDADEHYQNMVLRASNRVVLDGTFYGGKIENSIINHSWPQLYIGFTTNDGSNDYYHTAYLKDGQLYGTTYCPTLNMVQPWTAEKQQKK